MDINLERACVMGSARLNQPIWFVLLIIINTLGILEIIYLVLYSKHSVPIAVITTKKGKKSNRKKVMRLDTKGNTTIKLIPKIAII